MVNIVVGTGSYGVIQVFIDGVQVATGGTVNIYLKKGQTITSNVAVRMFHVVGLLNNA